MDRPPSPLPHSYGIIGNGRAATHFAHYFDLLGMPFRQWSRSGASARGKDLESSLREALLDCTHVVLLITDGEIESFIRKHPFLRSKHLVHCSGSLVTELAVGYHPLYSFSKVLYGLATYESIPFICEAGRADFRETFPMLTNPSIIIEPSLKPYYHALCVLSGNFTTLVWQKMFRELEARLRISSNLTSLYLESIVRNLKENPSQALTGPLARGDLGTIQNNLDALKHDPYVRLYRAMLEIVEPGRVKEVTR